MTRILIIEDDYSVRMGLIDLLEENGYSLFSAATGREGINLAKKLTPDLIICDIMMPETDGYQVIKALSEAEETLAIPFIFLTAKAEMTDIRKGMESGAADYLIKPYNASDLLKAISVRLEKITELKRHLQPYQMKKKTPLEENDHIILMVNKKPRFIRINQITSITAENVYTNIFLNDGTGILARKSMNEWEERLPEKDFIRIHRSTIINMSYIHAVEKWYNRSYLVKMKNSEQTYSISQRYALKIKDRIIS